MWTAAGYRKWGFTNGAVAAEILTALIRGREHEWAAFFDPYRSRPLDRCRKFSAPVPPRCPMR